jgi:hypothetical protein
MMVALLKQMHLQKETGLYAVCPCVNEAQKNGRESMYSGGDCE